MKILLTFFLLVSTCFAGRQIDASTQYIENGSVTQLGQDDPFTIEFQIFFDGSTNTSDFYQNATGTYHRVFNFATNDTRLSMSWNGGTTPSGLCQSPNLMSLATKVVYGRFSVNPATNTAYCEVYDILGAIFYSSGAITYASHGDATGNGFTIPGAGSGTLKYGFYRLLNVYVPPGSGVPYTSYNSNMIFHWKFDLGNNTGSLLDQAPGGLWNASMSSGSPTYTAQEGQTVVTSNPKTGDAPTWATWRTQRVGVTGQTLNGCTSITQADSGTLTYQWTQTVGPTLTLADDTACETVANGYTSHGSYAMELEVTDTDMNVGTATLNYGAVEMDANGVLIPRHEDVTKVYGPMISFGYSPWGDMDQKALYMVAAQTAYFTAGGFADPSWTHFGTGTVSYPMGSYGYGFAAASLDTTINSTDTSMIVDDAENIPCLVTLIADGTPCVIFFGIGWNSTATESARICSASASTGDNVTIGFCYDGRGIAWTLYNGEIGATASGHTAGVEISSRPVVGTSTQFISDSSKPWCPAGVGPPGAIFYQTGTVSVTGSSADIVGTGTAWSLATIGARYNMMRIEATHGGGTPFIFWGPISAIADTTLNGAIDAMQTTITVASSSPFPATPFTVTIGAEDLEVTNVAGVTWTVTRGENATTPASHGNGARVYDPTYGLTHVQLSRALPSDVDSGPFDYQILSTRYGVAEFQADGGSLLGYMPVTSCESETSAFSMMPRDLQFGILSQTMTGQITTIENLNSPASHLGPNFYGSGLALRAMYERSGYGPALTAARMMDDNWTTHPLIAGGWFDDRWLNIGGGAVGAWAAKVLDAGTTLGWQDVVHYAKIAAATQTPEQDCTAVDGRNTAYQLYQVVFGQVFDPDMTRHTEWTDDLVGMLTRLEGCATESDYSYASYYIREGAALVGLTENDDEVSGTGLTSDKCYGTGVQTVTMTNASQVITATSGTFPMGTVYIVVDGTFMAVEYVDSDELHIPVPWQGMTGSFSSMTTSNYGDGMNEMLAFGNGITAMSQNYMCIFNSSTSLTLDRPWHTTTGTYAMYINNLVGYGTQGYMNGMVMNAMTAATYSDDPTISAGFAALLPPSALWFRQESYDPDARGMFYGVKFQGCTGSSMTGTPDAGWGRFLVNQCRFGSTNGQKSASRTLTGESMAGLTAYSATGQPDALTWANDAYGAVYGGDVSLCSGAVIATCDGLTIDELSNSAMSGNKWPGFFFGMGMAHQWPAVYYQLLNGGEPKPVIFGPVTFVGGVRF